MYKNGERMMAWVTRIDEIKPIPGADRIVAYRVGGWWVVDQKDRYPVGDLVIYVSIDSWVPTEVAPFLSKDKEPREFNGVKGERLRTVRLKKQLSQGLLLPLNPFISMSAHSAEDGPIGFDCTELLGIQKWEAPVPPQLAGEIKAPFPSGSFMRSDQERIQNLNIADYVGMTMQVTEKLDGSSMSVYAKDLQVGVCSRNLDLKKSETNTFWVTAERQGLLSIVDQLAKEFDKGVMLQGELCGPGIQGNDYRLTEHKFFLYNIQLEGQEFLPPDLVKSIAKQHGINHVPVLETVTIGSSMKLDDLLTTAEGMSQLNAQAEREGLVFKSQDGAIQFKAISNRWLLKKGE